MKSLIIYFILVGIDVLVAGPVRGEWLDEKQLNACKRCVVKDGHGQAYVILANGTAQCLSNAEAPIHREQLVRLVVCEGFMADLECETSLVPGDTVTALTDNFCTSWIHSFANQKWFQDTEERNKTEREEQQVGETNTKEVETILSVKVS